MSTSATFSFIRDNQETLLDKTDSDGYPSFFGYFAWEGLESSFNSYPCREDGINTFIERKNKSLREGSYNYVANFDNYSFDVYGWNINKSNPQKLVKELIASVPFLEIEKRLNTDSLLQGPEKNRMKEFEKLIREKIKEYE